MRNKSNSKMADCPFCLCPIDRRTSWYFWDSRKSIVVCEDADPKEFKYRILLVPYGRHWHQPWQNYAAKERDSFLELMFSIVAAHVKNGARLVNMDTEHFSITEHGHIQANMR